MPEHPGGAPATQVARQLVLSREADHHGRRQCRCVGRNGCAIAFGQHRRAAGQRFGDNAPAGSDAVLAELQGLRRAAQMSCLPRQWKGSLIKAIVARADPRTSLDRGAASLEDQGAGGTASSTYTTIRRRDVAQDGRGRLRAIIGR